MLAEVHLRRVALALPRIGGMEKLMVHWKHMIALLEKKRKGKSWEHERIAGGQCEF